MPPQRQQDQDCSSRSTGPKGRKGPPDRSKGARGCSCFEPTIGIDTIVLTTRISSGIAIGLRGPWAFEERRQPITFRWQVWAFLDRSLEGWQLSWQEDDRVLEVRLAVPIVMSAGAVTNFPLQAFRLEALYILSTAVAWALGLAADDAISVLDWAGFGVKKVAYTLDACVSDPNGVIGVMHGFQRAGVWAGFRTTCRWRSGTRTVQAYAKGAESRTKFTKRHYAELERRHGPLDTVLRFEVTLGATDIKGLFGLTDTLWLPKLEAAIPTSVAAWVLYDEVYNRLKIRRVFGRKSRVVDRAMALAHDLVAEARAQGDEPNLALISKLLGSFLLLSGTTSTRELCEKFGFARATANNYKRRLSARGFPPGVGIEPTSQRLIGEFMRALTRVIGDAAPRKPVIPTQLRERLTITAPWLVDHDVTRSVPGISIDDGSIDAEILEAIKDL